MDRRSPRSSPRRRIPTPLLIVLAGALAVSVVRSSFGMVRITREGSSGAEIRIAAPVSDLESLLKYVDKDASSLEDVIRLPKDVQLSSVGAPRMGKETEFSRRKPW